jgi:HK97 gp10 family phage protein
VILLAKFEYKMPNEFIDKLDRLGERTDEIIPRVLEAGGEVVLNQVRSNLGAVLSGESSGQLQGALGLSPAKLDNNGNFNVKVGFDEPRRDGVSNAMVANILEYGRHGQPPRPFLKPAKTASRSAAIEAMKKKLEEELGDV